MANPVMELVSWARAARVAHAHCDVPCGLYHPHAAELAAETVEKMVEKLEGLGPDDDSLAWRNSATRMIVTKEEHAEIVKHEITILWGDYFKPPHLEQWPELHELVWNTLKLAGYNKQNVDMEAAGRLRGEVKKIADIFWESKK